MSTKTGGGGSLTLVIGGARSGKSSLVERLAHESSKRVAFIATARASDADMKARIERHQRDRPSDWPTIEEPVDLASAVRQAAAVADVVLLDCMTVWLYNWMEHTGLMAEFMEDTGGVIVDGEDKEGHLLLLKFALSFRNLERHRCRSYNYLLNNLL